MAIRESLLAAIDNAFAVVTANWATRANSAGQFKIFRDIQAALSGDVARPIYSRELARQVGVSVRTMHDAVQRYRGMSLHRYLRLRRLWLVRQRLLAGTPSVKACALALRQFPRANGAYRDGKVELYSRVNVGVAVAAQDALVVPTVYDADKKSLGEIARDARALAERVRANAVTPPELSGGTFTVSNLGMFGVTEFSAVINPPQAAILAVGKMEPRAVVRDGEITARNIMTITLVCDHRILYGADAAEFLARIRALLEQPISLAL